MLKMSEEFYWNPEFLLKILLFFFFLFLLFAFNWSVQNLPSYKLNVKLVKFLLGDLGKNYIYIYIYIYEDLVL